MYLDYHAAMRPPSQFFFPTQNKVEMQVGLSCPFAASVSETCQNKLEQQLAFRNLMLSVSPQANGATLNYDSQMLGAAGMYASSTPPFGQTMRGNRRQDARQKFAIPRSPILEEFKATRQIRLWKLRVKNPRAYSY
jgi:hypothetical protein